MEQEAELQAPMSAPYDVFINHRGPDVKNTLASLIYYRLTQCLGLRVFLDKNEIRKGETISNAIHAAIQNASIHITIFSVRYAESRWCLQELYLILRSCHDDNKKVIIPVFCDVEPADLRDFESGCYKVAFEKHQRKGRVLMENWKNALMEVSQISGLLFKTMESDYGLFLEEILGILRKELRKLYVPEKPVVLEQAVEDFPAINEILKQNESSDCTMIVGIAGMPGAGKSTLVNYIYDTRQLDFIGSSCILWKVRSNDSLSLQRDLHRHLLGYDQPCAEGKGMLRGRRILLVLDDVDRIYQIDDLIDIDAVGGGSLIVITSCHNYILKRSSPKTLVYQVKPLNRQQARKLFCQHAFSQSQSSEGFGHLVEEFLAICNGLPLSLKVLGGQFKRLPDREYWKRQLVTFSTTPHEDIVSPLKASYDALSTEEKEVFLDIGCFLVGEETGLAITVLSGLHGSDIVHHLESLHQKCFVEFHNDLQSDGEFQCRKRENPVIGYEEIRSIQYQSYKLTMHSHFMELAREIGRSQKPMRISNLNGNSPDFNLQDEVLVPIRGVRFSASSSFGSSSFRPIRGDRLKLLALEKTNLRWRQPGNIDFKGWMISGELLWLRLHNFEFEDMHFLSLFSLRFLRVLELRCPGHSIEPFCQGFLEQFIENADKLPSQLNELHISAVDEALPTTSTSRSTVDPRHLMKSSTSLFNFLASIGPAMKNLFKMVLTNLTSLESLPIEFENLGRLTHLDLSGCTTLTQLPNSFSMLLQLRYLALRDCRNLSIPPEILGGISTLEYVDFQGCAQLVTLPQGIPYQRHLRYLNLLSTCLSELPENLGRLLNLEILRIGSPALARLPLSVGNLRRLTELIVIQCSELQCLLPEGIPWGNIKTLTIDCCPKANFSFPKDEQTIAVLRHLSLKKTSISEINMVEGVYPRLETIDLSGNIRLTQVIALPSALVSVNLQNCLELKALKNLSNLVNLKFLNVNGCFELETLSVEGLISLEDIEAEKCSKLKRIEGWSSQFLNCLKISTDSGIFWEDVCKLLESPSSHALSNFFFTGKMDKMDDQEFEQITIKFRRHRKIDRAKVLSHTTTSSFLAEIEFGSNGAVLLWFITNAVGRRSFSVNFNDGYSIHEYMIHSGEGGGRRLHIFVWTLKSERSRTVRCSCNAIASESEKIFVANGQLLMVPKNRDVLEVCKDIIEALTHGMNCLDETLTNRPDKLKSVMYSP